MMYIKLLVLVGFDLHFPLIFGIYKLLEINAIHFLPFTLFYTFTLTTKICKKLNLFLVTKKLFYSRRKMMQLFKIFRKASLQNLKKNIVFVYILISNF